MYLHRISSPFQKYDDVFFVLVLVLVIVIE